jgi:hypothetical protein
MKRGFQSHNANGDNGGSLASHSNNLESSQSQISCSPKSYQSSQNIC